MDHNLFGLSEEEMRRVGYQVIDLLVEHYATLSEKPAGGHRTVAEMASVIEEPLPNQATPFNDLMATAVADIFPNNMYLNHPRFFGWVPGPSNFISVMADTLASGFNVFSGAERIGAAASQVESLVIKWLAQLLKMDPGADGILTSGGSASNLMGLATARAVMLGGPSAEAMVYCSDQTHGSNLKGLKLLGFSDDQVCVLPSDQRQRLDMHCLYEQIHQDRERGVRPFCVIANAGTTNTGSVDPLPEIRALCDIEGLWMHVDAAYGGAVWLSEDHQYQLEGSNQADSLTIDPHKWLYQPYDIGGLLVRDANHLLTAFKTSGSYLKETEQYRNFSDKGMQLSRRFRALPLWMSIKYYGIDTFRRSVAYTITLAEHAERVVSTLPEWQVVTAAQIGILTFRFAPTSLTLAQHDQLNGRIASHIMDEQGIVLSSTTVGERVVLRLCTINPATSHQDIETTLYYLDFLANKFLEEVTTSTVR
jgi:glutamate/tyrosine decarboxylase-like PLP-dependent enzyme